MAVQLPVKATWTAGKGGRSVFINPYGVRMMAKSQTGKLKFFWCSKTRVFNCPVRLILDTEEDMVTRIENEHCHDSDIMKENVKKRVKLAVENSVNHNSVPRTVFKDLSNALLADES